MRWRRLHGAGRRWRHTIQGRLVVLFLLLALCTAAVFLVGMQRVLQSGWQAWARPLISDYLDRLATDLGSPPDTARALALTRRLPIALRIDGPLVQWDSHPEQRHRHWAGNDDGDGNAGGWDDNWGLVRHSADGHRISFSLRANPDAAKPRLLGWMTLSLLLLLTLLAWISVRRQLAPLRSIGAGVEAFGRGRFDVPIPVPRNDELGDLAQRINGMASNLSGMLEAKRALLLAISHELRSPLTRARVNAELLEPSSERAALLRDLGEMRDLITQLLESERLVGVSQGHAALLPEPTDLAALVRDVVATHFADQALALDLQLPPPVTVAVDAMRMRLLLRNLIANALRHSSGAPQPAQVFLRREADGRVALGVRDHGPDAASLSDEQLAQLGQAFYRPDSARTRSGGGVGLGLYLCRLVAQAHGGELRIRRADPGLEVSAVWTPA